MTFEQHLRAVERANCFTLCDAGPGLHPYVLDKAARLAKEDPIYSGLVAEIGEHIGPDACVKADAALKWFARNP